MNTQVRRCQCGMTLIELVIAITVIGIAISSVLGVLSATALRSADAMIREQAVMIGTAYLDEVLLKPFATIPGGPARTDLNDIGYNGFIDNAAYDQGVHDQGGNLVSGTSQFSISIQVGRGALGGIPPADVHRIDVTVRHASGTMVLLSGYRTRY